MDNDYYSQTIAALEKAATDFKRAVDKQIVAFENEKRLHEEAIRSIDGLIMMSWSRVEKIHSLQQREKELLDQKSIKDADASNKEKEVNKIMEEIENLRVCFSLQFRSIEERAGAWTGKGGEANRVWREATSHRGPVHW